MSPLTTHVLDTARGKPAAGLTITLEIDRGGWKEIGRGVTNDDGRLDPGLLAPGALEAARYRIRFATAEYFAKLGIRDYFYPYVEVVFEIATPAEHHHVPLLLSPFGFSTYRGS